MPYHRKPTIKDIAKKAKVSRMTVSRVFSEKSNVSKEKADKIKKIAEELNYHPNLIARSLSSKSSNTIGVFVQKSKNLFLDIYITQILSGISDVLQELDYKIMFFPTDTNKENKNLYISIAQGQIVDGIIIINPKINDKGVDNLLSIDFPFILVNHRRNSKEYNFVDSRNEKGAKLAIEHLYNLGHRNIAFVSGPLDESNAVDRLNGFKKALKYYGLVFNKEWIAYSDFNKEKAYQTSKTLFKQKPFPTAIFCADDNIAIGVIEQIKENELRVPDDISVIGFDDIEMATYINPALTTIRQPIYEIGKKSAEILLDLINKKRVAPVQEYLDVELIQRVSTSKPSASCSSQVKRQKTFL